MIVYFQDGIGVDICHIRHGFIVLNDKGSAPYPVRG
jgi:hypothetical protein